GSNIGVILTALTIPFIIMHYGWRTAFMITGLLGIILLIVWLINYKKPEQSKKLSATELQYIKGEETSTKQENIPFFKLFRYKQAWIFAIGKFFADPIWYFFLT